MLISFGDYLPDQPRGKGLAIAENVYPAANGFRPVPSFDGITPALSGWSGGAAFVSSDGTGHLLSGTATNLYRYTGAAWSGVYTGGGDWRFAQFGDNIICVNGGGPVTYDAATSTAALTAGSPPNASMVTIVRDHVVLAGDAADNKTVTWSAFNNSEGWTSGTDQSGFQPMLEGGEVMGLAGGEYGIVLQRNAIKRMDYLGDDALVFSFGEISSNVGCMAKGSVAQAGRLVFFLSERGFMVCPGSDVEPIGIEQVDETFFKRYDRDLIQSIRAAIDPRRFIVAWAMPDMIWLYNWALKKWATIKIANQGVFAGFTSGTTLDALDADYPDLDAMTVSLDSAEFAGGDPTFYVVSGNVVGSLSGPPMAARLLTNELELSRDRVRVRSVRPITDATGVDAYLHLSERADMPMVIKQAASRRDNGDMPIRANGRHWQAEVRLSGAWAYFDGVNLELESGGYR